MYVCMYVFSFSNRQMQTTILMSAIPILLCSYEWIKVDTQWNRIPGNGASFDNDCWINSKQIKLGNSTIHD